MEEGENRIQINISPNHNAPIELYVAHGHNSPIPVNNTINEATNLDINVNVSPTPISPVGIKGAIAYSADHSRIWAEGTDEEVEKLGGERSAKGWAEYIGHEGKEYTDEAVAAERERAIGVENTLSNAIANKQDIISDLATIRSGAALGATAVQPGDLATVATTGDYDDLTNKPTIPSQASDVHALPDTTKYGASLDLNINSSTYVVTAQLKDQDGNTLGTAQTIDLPLESVVVGGSYDDATKKVVLTLQNGSTVEFSVADLVAGLQSEITSSNKLSADLVDDTNTTHKFVTASDKSTWNGKQDAISDLATIRSGAAAGATALQPSVAASTYATKAEIADQYTKSNLLPKVPVAFEKAQPSDLYTVVGSPTITNGVASGFSNSNYLKLDASTFDSSKSFEFVVKAKLNSFGKAVFGFNQPWTNVFIASQNQISWWLSSQTTGASELNVIHAVPLQTSTWYYFLFSYDGNSTYSTGVSTDGENFAKTSYSRSYTMGVTSQIRFGAWSQNSYQFDGEIDFNYTYVKVNGKYFVPPLSSSAVVSVSTMTGATSSAAGASGIVPAPVAGDNNKFLKGDGTWSNPTAATAWGNITGTLSDQTDLQNAINSIKRNIGEIVPSMIPLTDAGLHLLDGSVISGSGSYSAFVTYIAGLVSDYPGLFETEANWQTSVTNYGVCGKFVYDSVNNTVRLPKVTGMMEGTIDATAIGDLVEAGLPNLTGWVSFVRGDIIDSSNGAFYHNTSDTDRDHGGTGTANGYRGLIYDFSRGNSIYGNSNTVQPQTIKGFYYIVISNSTKTEIEVDIDEIATDLNGKADVGLANTVPTIAFASSMNTAGIRTVIETYSSGTSWYRVWSDGWCEQGGRVSLSQDSSTTINLLKPFTNTDANVVVSNYHDGTHDSNYLNGVAAYFTSGSTLKIAHQSGATSYNWYACGYIS